MSLVLYRTSPETVVTTGQGLVLLPVAVLVNRAGAAGHAGLAARLLGQDRTIS